MKAKPRVSHRELSLVQLEKILRDYESKYRMKSEEFYAKYNRGQLADDRDYVTWAGYFVMAVRSGLRDLVTA